MNEDKATRFHRLRRQAAVMAAAWSVLLLVLLLITGASAALRTSIDSLLKSSWVPTVLLTPAVAGLYAVAIALLHEIGAAPFAFYAGFVLERRYELSRQSWIEWGRDHFKALALGLAFIGLAAAFLYTTITVSPDRWWMMATAGALLVSIGLAWITPVFLFPLFFRLTRVRDQELRARLAALAERAGAPITDIYEWRLSDRTSRANAALTGFGRTRRILLSDTLLAEYSIDEIEVVLAHELSHHVHRDVWRALAFESLVAGAGLWAAASVLRRVLPSFGISGSADVAGLPLLLLTVMAVSFLALPIANAISRWRERRADRFSLEVTRSPAAFTSAMARLAARNLAEEDPSLLARLFFYTHPPFSERLAFAKTWAARQSRG